MTMQLPDPMNLGFNVEPKRKCGTCQLCCRLVPVKELNKPANTRCTHQRHGKGCAIYPERPSSCRLWSCLWLLGRDTDRLRRPDLTHYVIDMIPEVITVEIEGKELKVEAVQIWHDPKHRDAWQGDPELEAFIKRRGAEGKAILIRYDQTGDTQTVLPPLITAFLGAPPGTWSLIEGGMVMSELSVREHMEALAQVRREA